MTTTNEKMARELVAGDVVVDHGGLALKVTAVAVASPMFMRVTVEYVEAGMMIVRPEPKTWRVKKTAIVRMA